MRLIDADALLDKIHNVDGMEVFENSNIFAMHYERMVKSMPTIEERMMSKWNVITKRPMTENERNYYNEEYDCNLLDDEAVIYNNLPDDDVEVLICNRYGFVFIDTLLRSGGCVYFDREGDLDDVVAWMPLPEPYKEVDE